MSNPATLYRFRISVSDIDRGFYETLDFRAAKHPSESEQYLLTRVIAYALCYQEGLEFLPGLCTGDDPAIRLLGPNGEIAIWIDIGNPAARRLHKASKAARAVRIYTYKDPENIKREAKGESIHRAGEIEIFALDARFLDSVGATLKKDNRWDLIFNEGELVINAGEETFMTSIAAHRLESSQ